MPPPSCPAGISSEMGPEGCVCVAGAGVKHNDKCANRLGMSMDSAKQPCTTLPPQGSRAEQREGARPCWLRAGCASCCSA